MPPSYGAQATVPKPKPAKAMQPKLHQTSREIQRFDRLRDLSLGLEVEVAASGRRPQQDPG